MGVLKTLSHYSRHLSTYLHNRLMGINHEHQQNSGLVMLDDTCLIRVVVSQDHGTGLSDGLTLLLDVPSHIGKILLLQCFVFWHFLLAKVIVENVHESRGFTSVDSKLLAYDSSYTMSPCSLL